MVTYADGPSTSVDVHIAAAPESVWPLVSDINGPAAFSAEFQGAEWLDDGPALGARFRGRNRHQVVGEWTVTCTITAFEEPRVFEWTVGDITFRSARWRFDLEPEAGGTRLRFSAEMGPGPSGLTPAIERMPDREEDIVARRLGEWTANMQATVDGYKQHIEAETEADSEAGTATDT